MTHPPLIQHHKNYPIDHSELLENPLGKRVVLLTLLSMCLCYGVSLISHLLDTSYAHVLVLQALSGLGFGFFVFLASSFHFQKLDSKKAVSYLTFFNIFYLSFKLFYIGFVEYDPLTLVYFLSSEMLYATCIPMMAYSMSVSKLAYSMVWFQAHFLTFALLLSLFLGRSSDSREIYSLLQLALVYWIVLLAVSLYSRTVRRLWQAKRDNIMLTQLAYQDELTGLPNRRGMERKLEELIQAGQQKNFEVAILFVDLDGFKPINDTLGHQFGDELLRGVAKRLKQQCHEWSIVTRVNGDEFVLLAAFEKIVESEIKEYANALHKHLSLPIIAFGQQIEMTASIGISRFPQDGDSPQELLRRADVAMLSVKKSGKNAVQFYGTELHSASEYNQVLLREMVGVQTRGELHLVFQPIYNIHTGGIYSFEALIRWNHPLLGPISPQAFIPLAESSGMILPIGHWVLCTALDAALLWRREGLPNTKVAINISPLQLLQTDFFDFIQQELSKRKLSGKVLEIEITEGLEISDRSAVIHLLQRLRSVGVHISLDDFGEGFASLSHLRDLPLNTVKLDRSFVAGLKAELPSTVLYAKALIQAVLHLANTLNIKVVAEGIETQDQFDLLGSMGCHYGQGYYLMYPVKLERLLTEVKERA